MPARAPFRWQLSSHIIQAMRRYMHQPVAMDTLKLLDGRVLRLARYGSDDPRHAIFYFHGFPGSHYEASFLHRAAARRDVSILVLERPGLGGSDFDPARSILTWPDTVLYAAEAIGLEQFSVFGVSGGGPYAAACAYKIDERLSSVGIMSGVSPLCGKEVFDGMNFLPRLVLSMGLRAPLFSKLLAASFLHWWRLRPKDMLTLFRILLSVDDKRILADDIVAGVVQKNLSEALKNGIYGAMHEFKLLLSPWGFDLREVHRPVVLWHGTSDCYIPLAMGKLQAKLLPQCETRFIDGKGHFMAAEMGEEILDALAPQLSAL